MVSAIDFVLRVESNLEADELHAMVMDCIRITREGNTLDEGYIKHALFCSEHMIALNEQYRNGYR